VEQAALSAGFGSAAALRAFTRRLVGISPTLVAARGGSAFIVEQFSRVLRDQSDRTASFLDTERVSA
jgi:AraC-like DNA-binding protein